MIKLLKYFIILLLLIIITWFFLPKPTLLQNYSFSKVIYDTHQRLLRITLSDDQKYRVYTPLSQISPELIAATLLQEDRYFYAHHGINLVTLTKALWQSYIIRQHAIGASTISMQVARMRFNLHTRNALGKLQQIFRALQLERHYSKNQILEAYFNLASYGQNIEGVTAASTIYFHKPANQLTLPDALLLTVIPQNPRKRAPINTNKQALWQARQLLFERWLVTHASDAHYQTTLNLPQTLARISDLPFAAPHLTTNLIKNTTAEHTIQTTIDLDLQILLEQHINNYLASRHHYGFNNASVMLVDANTMEVKALVGSANFFNDAIAGQVDGSQMRRSPGSTLKPFIYALAMEQGLIHPLTILKDTPKNYSEYNPENFDYDFLGPINATDALNKSRNIPVIELANQLTQPSFYQFLQMANIQHLKEEQHYGLSLVLGGAEVSMVELVQLYAMLYNGGIIKPLRYLKNDPMALGKLLLSPEVCFLVLHMLSQNPPPAHLAVAADAISSFPVAWKTGTSTGYRDAWAIAVLDHYIIAVWIGNFDGSANPNFVGRSASGPLLMLLVQAVKQHFGHLTPLAVTPPAHLNLVKIPVCEASGGIPNEHCPQVIDTWYIPGKSPLKHDTVYRQIAVNQKTGLRSCHYDHNTRLQVYEFWPNDLLASFQQAGMQRNVPPLYEAGCSALQESTMVGQKLEITSPYKNTIYTLIRKQKNVIPLTAIADAEVQELYWFLNQRYLGKSKPNQPFYWIPESGHFIVRVLDDHGHAAKRTLNVSVIH